MDLTCHSRSTRPPVAGREAPVGRITTLGAAWRAHERGSHSTILNSLVGTAASAVYAVPGAAQFAATYADAGTARLSFGTAALGLEHLLAHPRGD